MDKLFGLNGLAGFALAVVVLLSVVAFLGTCAILTQQEQATNFYKIENLMMLTTIAMPFIPELFLHLI